MRKLVLIAIVVLASATYSERSARADVGVGAFFGEPTGLDVKLGLAQRSSLDILIGWYSDWDNGWHVNHGAYGHVTYLLTPMVGHGQSVLVPLRVGIGGAIYDQGGHFNDDLNLAARVPFEIALAFRRTPLEIYGEIAIKITILDENDNHPTVDLDGGIGIRFYF
jgi:hypothetical protein